MNSKILLSLIVLLSALGIGCVNISGEETFVIESGYYYFIEFELLEYDILEINTDTGNTPISVYVLDPLNFNRYESGSIFNSPYFRENSIKSQLSFEAPQDGKYYVVFESLSSDARVEVVYNIY